MKALLVRRIKLLIEGNSSGRFVLKDNSKARRCFGTKKGCFSRILICEDASETSEGMSIAE
jgi:hypothetical protein